ncbi:hypothetical protein VPIG_00022 [Vibrio phage PWH3a-P1]|uniref:hypothetical protein n=1 Tax=Vibrio phage PWH3a-P1 TaxID=754058 RepID=UPI0002C0A1ED|nr:hypothetical protein VPIG_00022 [Vibrio phage PWH3a-P1]AGH31880.1 hypothetical protein VPIG_00022 [Vibrio phage PWH3a-P1]
MNTVLEAIQQNPECFISTLESRAMTTPSQQNKDNHTCLSIFIKYEKWDDVKEILLKGNYQQAFDGVVYCLSTYSGINNKVWHKVVDLWNEGKVV